jgi:para-aminobenzoate synthetase component 1
VSIKKIKFLPDFSKLSEWGRNGTPFFALVDFEGRLAAEPLDRAVFTAKTGLFSGRITFGDAALRFKFNIASHQSAGALPNDVLRVLFPPTKPSVIAAIAQLQRDLGDGLSYLINYCTQTEVAVPHPMASLFEKSTAPFTVWLEGAFLSFSPEAFVSVVNNEIVTTPMKGTGHNAQALLADVKEQAEHATIVDLLRNDLGRVARDIRVADYRYVIEIPQADGRTLYQTSTQISGQMRNDWKSHIGDWLPLLLPPGSVTGAPKKKTVELIRRYETEQRGFFTGVAVLFDGENLYSCVLIRYLDLSAEVLKFRSGAGITIYSEPEAEYDEILSKVYLPV